MTNHLAGGPPAKLFVWFHRQQKCSKVRDSTPHTPFRSSMERRWGSNLTVFVAPPTVAGAVPWWLLFLSSACLWCPRSSTASSRRARAPHANLPSVRELRIGLRVLVVTSSESLSTAGLSRCPRTVLKARLLLFATCTGEANALRKSRLRDELLLVKAQLRFFGRSPARRPR